MTTAQTSLNFMILVCRFSASCRFFFLFIISAAFSFVCRFYTHVLQIKFCTYHMIITNSINLTLLVCRFPMLLLFLDLFVFLQSNVFQFQSSTYEFIVTILINFIYAPTMSFFKLYFVFQILFVL